MLCPYCSHTELKVIDSRDSKDGEAIKRRRKCLKCNKRFTTVEKILKLDLEVQKTNGETEVFNLLKIKRSIMKCCDKRPITLEHIDNVTQDIILDLKKSETGVISSTDIGKNVMCHLFKLDKMAFLKYAIVHHKYNSFEEFTQYLEKLQQFPDHIEEFEESIIKQLVNKERLDDETLNVDYNLNK